MERKELFMLSNEEINSYLFTVKMTFDKLSNEISHAMVERDDVYDEIKRINKEIKRRNG